MADVRVVMAHRPRVSGTKVGVRISTFGMDRLMLGITGQDIAEILLEAMQPSFDQAHSEWPVWTGASRDSMSLDTVEVEAHRARVVLQVGGERLISDPRNKSRKDYAPFIEFNGTRNAPPGIIFDATYGRDAEIRRDVHIGISTLIRGLVG